MKKILSKLYSIYFILVGILFVVVTFFIAKIIKFFLGNSAFNSLRKLYKITSRIILFVQGVKLSVKGSFPKGTYVYCMNHQSDLDILISLAILPSGFLFVAKEELLKTPFIGSMIKMAGYITIDRKNARRSTETLDTIKEELNKGRSVLVFPEGTRSIDGEIQQIKRGGLQVAFQTKTPIVPVVNDPVYKIFNKSEKNIQHQNVKTIVGNPISYDWDNDTRDYSIESASKLEKIMKDMLKKLR